MTAMKCLSLWQPWASLIACGLKRFETRAWPTSYRGALAIHAARHVDAYAASLASMVAIAQPGIFDAAAAGLTEAGTAHEFAPGVVLPVGCIVATVRLAGCFRVDPTFRASLSTREERFGNYADGRYAWQLSDLLPRVVPLPLRGRQGLFNLPPEIVAALLPQRSGL